MLTIVKDNGLGVVLASRAGIVVLRPRSNKLAAGAGIAILMLKSGGH